MTTIRATCPSCGEVDLRPNDIELRVVRSDDGNVGNGSTYEFACPTCTDRVVKPADSRIARLLATGGVAVSVKSEVRAEPHPEMRPDGPKFGYDDVLDFHLLLSSDDWYAQLLAVS